MLSRKYELLLLLLCQIAFGQTANEKILHGKIVVESRNIAGVTVINLVTEKSTVSDSNGAFFILAKAEDLLVFSSVNLEYHRRIIEEDDLKSDIITIKMIPKITELKEVIINKNPEINAVSLGISPKGIKHRTQMERKLYAAGDFKPIDLLGLLGGSLDVDAILNSINGRTAMTKKLIKLENKISALEKTNLLFEDKYYINTLKIPADYVKGFKYYIIENEGFTAILKSKNNAKIEFAMNELASKYNQIRSNEN